MVTLLHMGSSRDSRFRQLYKRYYAPYCIYARRFIDDLDTRQDLVSDVFVSLWEHHEVMEQDDDHIKAFLCTCTRNACLNHLKHEQHGQDYASFVQEHDPPYVSSPDSVLTVDEMYELIYRLLSQLPEAYQLVFMRSFYDNKSQAEIAEELNISIKSVNRYKQKVLQLLRDHLKDYLPAIALTLLLRGISHHL